MADKIYINGCFINEHVFQDGGSILKLSVPADKVSEFLAALQSNATPRGINLQITKRRTPSVSQKTGKVYATHSLSVDTWGADNAAGKSNDAPW